MKKLLAFTAGLALAASAQAGFGGARTDYAAYAVGEPLRSINYYQLYNWHRSTDEQVVVWTKPSEAYMLSLAHQCDELRGAVVSIAVGGVAAVPGKLMVGDDLLVGQIKCRIAGIQALDLKTLEADRKAKRLKTIAPPPKKKA